MKEFKIKSANSKYFTPSVEWWIYETFDLDLTEGVFYKIFLQKGYGTWSWKLLSKMLHTSRSTIGRVIKKLKEMEIIYVHPVYVIGRKMRSVIIPLYTEHGKISDEQLQFYINCGTIEIHNDIECDDY